jgi:hypothetical protein
MKTYEITRVLNVAASYLKATEMDEFFEIANEVRDASAKPLKKSTEVFIVRTKRVNAKCYKDVFMWVPCDEDGAALTPTGLLMGAKHKELAWR